MREAQRLVALVMEERSKSPMPALLMDPRGKSPSSPKGGRGPVAQASRVDPDGGVEETAYLLKVGGGGASVVDEGALAVTEQREFPEGSWELRWPARRLGAGESGERGGRSYSRNGTKFPQRPPAGVEYRGGLCSEGWEAGNWQVGPE